MADDIVSRVLGQGWQGLEEGNQMAQRASYEQRLRDFKEAEIIASAFQTPQGQAALNLLRQKTVLFPTWEVDRVSLLDAVGYGIFREGQNSLCRWIEACLARVEEGPPEAPSEGGGQGST